jgi:hypothetical protein
MTDRLSFLRCNLLRIFAKSAIETISLKGTKGNSTFKGTTMYKILRGQLGKFLFKIFITKTFYSVFLISGAFLENFQDTDQLKFDKVLISAFASEKQVISKAMLREKNNRNN